MPTPAGAAAGGDSDDAEGKDDAERKDDDEAPPYPVADANSRPATPSPDPVDVDAVAVDDDDEDDDEDDEADAKDASIRIGPRSSGSPPLLRPKSALRSPGATPNAAGKAVSIGATSTLEALGLGPTTTPARRTGPAAVSSLGRVRTAPSSTAAAHIRSRSARAVAGAARAAVAARSPLSGAPAPSFDVSSARDASEALDSASEAIAAAFSEVRALADRLGRSSRIAESALQAALRGAMDPVNALGAPKRAFRASQLMGDLEEQADEEADGAGGDWPSLAPRRSWVDTVPQTSDFARQAVAHAERQLQELAVDGSHALRRSLEETRTRQRHAVSMIENVVDRISELAARTGSRAGHSGQRADKDDPVVTKAVHRDITSMRKRLNEMGSRLAAAARRESLVQSFDAAMTLESWHQPLVRPSAPLSALEPRVRLLTQWRDQINSWIVFFLRTRVQDAFLSSSSDTESLSMLRMLRPDAARGVYSEAALFDPEDLPADVTSTMSARDARKQAGRRKRAADYVALDEARVSSLRKAVLALAARNKVLSETSPRRAKSFLRPMAEAEYLLALEAAVRAANDAAALYDDFATSSGWFHPRALMGGDALAAFVSDGDTAPGSKGGEANGHDGSDDDGEGSDGEKSDGSDTDDEGSTDGKAAAGGAIPVVPGMLGAVGLLAQLHGAKRTPLPPGYFQPRCTGLDTASPGPCGSMGKEPVVRLWSLQAFRDVVKDRLMERVVVAERRVRLACLRFQLMQSLDASGCLVPAAISGKDRPVRRARELQAAATGFLGGGSADSASVTAGAAADAPSGSHDEESDEDADDAADTADAGGDATAKRGGGQKGSARERRAQVRKRMKQHQDAALAEANDDDAEDEAGEGGPTQFSRPRSEILASLGPAIRVLVKPLSSTDSFRDETWAAGSGAAWARVGSDSGLVSRMLACLDDFDVSAAAQPWLETGDIGRIAAVQHPALAAVLEGSFANVKRRRAASGSAADAAARMSRRGLSRTSTQAQLRSADARKMRSAIGRAVQSGTDSAPSAQRPYTSTDGFDEAAFALDSGLDLPGPERVVRNPDNKPDVSASAFEQALCHEWDAEAPPGRGFDAAFHARRAALLDLANARLRRSGRDFALLDLWLRHAITESLVHGSGRTLVEMEAHLVRGHRYQHLRGESYTAVGQVSILLRSTSAGQAFAAVEMGLHAQVVHNHRNRLTQTGVSLRDSDALAAADAAVSLHAPLVPHDRQQSIVGRAVLADPAVPEAPASPLYWHTLFAAPFVPFSSNPAFTALWRNFRIASRPRHFAKQRVIDMLSAPAQLRADLDKVEALEDARSQQEGKAGPARARVAVAVIEAADAMDEGGAATAEETPWGPADRRRIIRHLVLRVRWPDIAVPAAITAQDNAADDGSFPDPAARDASAAPGALHSLLAPEMLGVLPASFEYLHDPEVLASMQELTVKTVENPAAFNPFVSAPAGLDALANAATSYFGPSTGRLFSVMYQTGQLWSALVLILVIVRIAIAIGLLEGLAPEVAAWQQSLADATGTTRNAENVAIMITQAAYAAFVLFVWIPIVISTTRRSWAFESLLSGRPIGIGTNTTADAANRADAAARSTEALQESLQSGEHALDCHEAFFEPSAQRTHGMGATVDANQNVTKPAVDALPSMGRDNDSAVGRPPAWEAERGEVRLRLRRDLYGSGYILLDWSCVVLLIALQGTAVWAFFQLAQFLERTLDGGDPADPTIITSLVMVAGVPLAAAVLHSAYSVAIKPSLLRCCCGILTHRTATDAAAPHVAARPDAVAASWRGFFRNAANRMSRRYTDNDEQHDTVTYVTLMAALYMGPALYIAVLGDRVHDSALCPGRDCFFQAAIQQIVAQGAFVLSLTLAHVVSAQWGQPAPGTRASFSADAVSGGTAVRALAHRHPCDAGTSAACVPIRISLHYICCCPHSCPRSCCCLGLLECLRPLLCCPCFCPRHHPISTAGAYAWPSFFVARQLDNDALAVSRETHRARRPDPSRTLEGDDDADFASRYAPLSTLGDIRKRVGPRSADAAKAAPTTGTPAAPVWAPPASVLPEEQRDLDPPSVYGSAGSRTAVVAARVRAAMPRADAASPRRPSLGVIHGAGSFGRRYERDGDGNDDDIGEDAAAADAFGLSGDRSGATAEDVERAAGTAMDEVTRHRREAGRAAAAEAALFQLTAPTAPRTSCCSCCLGSVARTDAAWWAAMQPPAPPADQVAASIALLARNGLPVTGLEPGENDADGTQAPGPASAASAGTPDLCLAGTAGAFPAMVRPAEEEAQGLKAYVGLFTGVADDDADDSKASSPSADAPTSPSALDSAALQRAAAARTVAVHAARRSVVRSKAHLAAHCRPYTVLPDPDITADMPRLGLPRLHDDAHAVAIQAFLFASTVLLAVLPFPFAPIIGLVYSFLEARLVTVRRVFGTRAVLPRPASSDRYRDICYGIAAVATLTNGLIGGFIRVLDWDAAFPSQAFWMVIVAVVVVPMLMAALIHPCLVRACGRFPASCCCGRASALTLITAAEVPYSEAREQLFDHAERLKLHARDTSGTHGLFSNLQHA